MTATLTLVPIKLLGWEAVNYGFQAMYYKGRQKIIENLGTISNSLGAVNHEAMYLKFYPQILCLTTMIKIWFPQNYYLVLPVLTQQKYQRPA